MSNKMLIDASHPEETRVVVVRGNKIEEFDFESEHKKQLKGNVYLARVTRVEPSLQAAFVEYGGNRHGFLAFSEIHPDYYQISAADRQALVEAEARAQRDDDDEDQEEAPRRNSNNNNRRNNNSDRRRGSGRNHAQATTTAAPVADTVPAVEFVGDFAQASQSLYEDARKKAIAALNEQAVIREKAPQNDQDNDDDHDDHDDEDDQVESIGAEDALEELPGNNRPHRKHYKIQDVIKRRQILLVQVVKEERGNKGAALTTYLSLAGRYSVLMPNTARGGGISRKITNVQDRKRLKEIVKELEVPQGMGVILRTAGANRTKAEVRRDYEYLMRMWDNVRTLTMQSSAPALVYEEGNLIKRTIRDLYNKDITELVVAGEAGYREAKDFMRMLMPSHAKVVQPYRESTPIFARNGIEAQLDRMLHPQVTLKSGGYIIINQTEALVAVDVNSGRSTRESSIEDTALQTNLEAAEEVARQLRLRDLAGLVVVDFIDMEEKRNNRAVEKRMKDCLKDDRARIQVGRISHFGLLEMSRQRIRASVLESTMQPCPHCAGTGMIRSDSSMALFVIRSIEEYLQRHNQNNIIVRMPAATALYVLNQKRHLLAEMEARFGLLIEIQIDESVGHQHLAIDKGAPATGPIIPVQHTIQFMPSDEADDLDIVDDEDEDEEEVETSEVESDSTEDDASDENNRKRRRRRRRRGGRDRDASDSHDNDDQDGHDGDGEQTGSDHAGDHHGDDAGLSEEDRRKKRRRGRRGGRKNRRNDYENGARVPSVEFVGYSRDEAYARLADYDAAHASAPQAIAQSANNNVQAPEFVGYTPVKSVALEQAPVAVTSDKAEAKPADQKKSARKRPLRNRNSKAKTADAGVVEDTADAAHAEDAAIAAPVLAETETVVATAEPVEDVAVAEVADTETAKPARKKAAAKTEKPARAPRKPRAKKGDDAEPAAIAETEAAVVAPVEVKVEAPAPAPVETKVEKPVETAVAETKPAPVKPAQPTEPAKPVVTSQGTQADTKTETAATDQPKRGGWWQKKGFF